MKIIYATRLFSGLERSFIDCIWDPVGVPTIYKLIEELDRSHDVKFIFSAKDWSNRWRLLWRSSEDHEIIVKGLANKIMVLAGIDYFPDWFPRRMAIAFREIRQYIYIIYTTLRSRPDIFYCDHANVVVGAILSRIQKHTVVVYRVMGIDPTMRTSLTSNNIIYKIFANYFIWTRCCLYSSNNNKSICDSFYKLCYFTNYCIIICHCRKTNKIWLEIFNSLF